MRTVVGAVAILMSVALAACAAAADTSTPVPDDGGPLFDGRSAATYYRENCSSCHGSDRAGQIGPSLRPEALTKDDSIYLETIANGRSGTAMPAWRRSGLTDREIEALVEFLHTEP